VLDCAVRYLVMVRVAEVIGGIRGLHSAIPASRGGSLLQVRHASVVEDRTIIDSTPPSRGVPKQLADVGENGCRATGT